YLVRIDYLARKKGRADKVWGQIGVIIIEFILGLTIGPPAERE
ncbi:unnamed protein product, partial [marine sediment metagenome]